MSEKAPLPSSVTQPHSGEASPVQPAQEAPKPDYSRQHKYVKSEQGKKTRKRWLKTEKGRKYMRETKKRWRSKRRQEKLSQHLTTNPPK